jgi:subtilisin family serine protease
MIKNLFACCFSLVAYLSLGQVTDKPHRILVQLTPEYAINALETSSFLSELTNRFDVISIEPIRKGKKAAEGPILLSLPFDQDPQELLVFLSICKQVSMVEMDDYGSTDGKQQVVPSDPDYTMQWALDNNGTFSLSPATAGADISMEQAWEIEQGDSSILVAVIDSGNKMDHPDFAGRLWTNYNEIPSNDLDDDSNGFVDDVQGWDFAYTDNLPADDMGHGTNVAGIIGLAANNGSGLAGVDWNCKLMILKGLNAANFGYYSWWASAIYYAVDNGANVINMSLAGNASSGILQSAITEAVNNGVTVVASMGNTNTSTKRYPAGCNGVIAVGATDPDDSRSQPFFWGASSGSNYGTHISVVAPGNFIYGADFASDTNYSLYWGGTSQAAPHVSGVAALLLAQDPGRSPSDIKLILEETAEDMVGPISEDVPGFDAYFGHGRINAYEALSYGNVGIQTLGKEPYAFAVFPNPTDDQLYVQLPNEGVKGEWLLLDATGKCLIQHHADEGGNSFSLHGLAAGTYFLQLKVHQSVVGVETVVVR